MFVGADHSPRLNGKCKNCNQIWRGARTSDRGKVANKSVALYPDQLEFIDRIMEEKCYPSFNQYMRSLLDREMKENRGEVF